MFRLLWAQAIDDVRTAIVIEYGNRLLGGVACLRRFDFSFGYHGWQSLSGTLDLVWEWYEVVESAEAFRKSERWKQRRGEQLEQPEQKQLGAPPKQISEY